MEQIIRLYVLFVVFCFLLVGCNNDEDIGNFDNPVAVQFGSDIAQTKTMNNGSQWIQGDGVGIFMVTNGQTLNNTNIAESADNIKYQAQVGGSNISGFKPSVTGMFYPQDVSQVDFIAYYPFKTTVTDYILPINVNDQTNPANIDVLYANTANTASSGYNKNSGTVDLQFKHALSKLSFTLLSGPDSPNLTGAKIEITNVSTTAEMELKDGTVSPSNRGETLIANTTTNGLSSSAIVIPQDVLGTMLIVTLADNVSKFEWDFTTDEFLPGENHQYNILVSKTGITVSPSGITTWTGINDLVTSETAKKGYKVGDYYPYQDDGSSAIGVVFETSNGGANGKIVSLDEVTNVKWWFNNSVPASANPTNVENGLNNMKTVYEEDNGFLNYPVFAWIHQKNGGGTTNYYSNINAKGVWYLPAKDELQHLLCATTGKTPETWINGNPSFNSSYGALDLSTFNTKLTSAGGTAFSNLYHWSSTWYSSNYAWYVSFNSGNTSNGTNANSARAILAF